MRPVAIGSLLLALAVVAGADEETADFFCERAKEALDEGDLDKATHWIDRARKEKESYAPAMLLAADVALRRERREEAVRCLELCLARESDDASEREKAAIREAKKRLRKLDESRFELEAILDDYAKKVAALARKQERGDAELARACWKSILLVRPDDPAAKEALQTVAPDQGEGEALWNGKDLEGWNGSAPGWTVRDGILTGTVRDAGDVNRCTREVKGDYSIVVEARMREDLGRDPAFAILYGLRNKYDNFGLWVWSDRWAYQHSTKPKEFDELAKKNFRNHKAKFDRFDWNTYRVDVEGKKVTGYVNGHRLWSTSGAIRELDGWVALLIQDGTVEVRSVRFLTK